LPTTPPAFRRLAAPLLARNPDLALVGRRIVLRPLRHVACGLLLGPGRTKTDLNLDSFVCLLANPVVSLHLTYGPWFPCPPELFQVDHPDGPDTLARVVEAELLPRLREIRTVEQFYLHATRTDDERVRGVLYNHLSSLGACYAALGLFEEALPILQGFIAGQAGDEDGRKPALRAAELLEPLRNRDPQAVGAVLRGWEQVTVSRFKLVRLWEPAPFPFEEAEVPQSRPVQQDSRQQGALSAANVAGRLRRMHRPGFTADILAPLLMEHPDLVFHKGAIRVRPVRHVLRSVRLSVGSSWGFQLRWGVMLLCRAPHPATDDFTARQGPEDGDLWDLLDPERAQEVRTVISEVALPWLRAMETPEAMAAPLLAGLRAGPDGQSLRPATVDRPLILAAAGLFPEALDECKEVVRTRAFHDGVWADRYERVVSRLRPLLKKGKPEPVAELLAEWESESVVALGLEEIWKPAPFSCEAQK
jgi:hypothetical protein